jgi:hypothetical protein
VRRDVRQAAAWDEELCALDGDLREIRLLEVHGLFKVLWCGTQRISPLKNNE